MTEWRTVVGWPKYQVSDDGQVIGPRGRVLKQRLAHGGYKRVNLYNGQSRVPMPRTVHILVLEAFVGPRPEGLWGLHRNGQCVDNRVDNLYWGTPEQNVADALRHGTYRNGNTEKTHCKSGHEFTPENTRRFAGGTRRECRACRKVLDQKRWAEAQKKKKELR